MATSFALWHCQLLRFFVFYLFFVFFCWLTIFRRFIQCWACRLPFFKACLNPVEEQDSCSHWQRYFNQRNDGVLLHVIMAKWPLITLIRPPKFYRSILLLFFYYEAGDQLLLVTLIFDIKEPVLSWKELVPHQNLASFKKLDSFTSKSSRLLVGKC